MTGISGTVTNIEVTIRNLNDLRLALLNRGRENPNLSDMASIRRGVINMKKKSSNLLYKV